MDSPVSCPAPPNSSVASLVAELEPKVVRYVASLADCMRMLLSSVLAALVLVGVAAQSVDTDRIVRAAQKYGPTGVANARALQQLMGTLAGRDDLARLRAVNDFYNQRLAYMEDIDNWGVQDYWASPLESLGKGAGDCEDYAIGKYFTLTSLGIPHARLRMVYVRASIDGAPNGYVPHMVLAYYPRPDAGRWSARWNRPDIRPAADRPDLAPVFSFNAEGLWQGVGSIRANGDPMTRLSKWREAVGRARADGFQ